MKVWQEIKGSEAEKYFGDGVRVDVIAVGSELRSVTVTTADGKSMKIEATNSYSHAVSIQTPKPPKTEKKFEVSGTILDGSATVNSVVDTEHEAKAAVERIECDGLIRNSDKDKVSIKPIDVEIPF